MMIYVLQNNSDEILKVSDNKSHLEQYLFFNATKDYLKTFAVPDEIHIHKEDTINENVTDYGYEFKYDNGEVNWEWYHIAAFEKY